MNQRASHADWYGHAVAGPPGADAKYFLANAKKILSGGGAWCSAALAEARAEEAVLVDCATLWLTNHLLADHDLIEESGRLLAALSACSAPVVIVTNETGWGIVPENALARRFRDEQGRLNQRLAAASALVVTVIAGLPMVLKGTLP